MKILLTDDDYSIRKGIEVFLISEGHKVKCCQNGNDAFETLKQGNYDLIISDNMMPGITGLELLHKLKNTGNVTPFILITAYASVQDAVSAMKSGAEDYLTKPLNLEELKLKIEKISKNRKLIEENKTLKDKLSLLEFPDMIGESKPLIELKNKIIRVAADPDVSVMIYGQSGTGKELVARNIHKKSCRADKPFIAVNCAALSGELLESELFGHVKGAFTNAVKDREGLFSAADKGTIFLDEVSEMSQNLQAKLLRVLQERNFMPVGSTQIISVDVRIIGASNKELLNLVKEGKFREDLFYRMYVVEIKVPSLSERIIDIPLLVNHFLDKEFNRTGRKKTFCKEVIEILQKLPWQGNIRELENIVKMICVTSENSSVRIQDIPESIHSESLKNLLNMKSGWQENDFQTSLGMAVEYFEKEYLKFHIEKNNGNISRVSEKIGLSRVSLHKKINQYKLEL